MRVPGRRERVNSKLISLEDASLHYESLRVSVNVRKFNVNAIFVSRDYACLFYNSHLNRKIVMRDKESRESILFKKETASFSAAVILR